MVKLTSIQYAQDKATFSDLLKAQSQQAQLSYDLILLRELQEVEEANIRSLLNLPQDTPLGAPVSVSYMTLKTSLDELGQRALQQRQELQIADLMAQKAEKGVQLAKMQNKPMFNLELMTIETGDALMLGTQDSGKNPWSIGLGFSIPLWSAKKNGRVREAELNQQTALENKQWMEAQVLANLKKVYFRLENSRRLVELYENALIPQAEKAIEVAETWHQEGEPESISGLLETQSVWLNFNLACARAIADYQQNLARMEQITGGSLDTE
jgi:cobalt-zinc-cadmium efflux system outer membrane protein